MRLARTLRLDESDLNIFEPPADIDEWAISGAFEFSNWTEAELSGKRRQAFANGWLGLESFGRATFVVVCEITEAEHAAAVERLAAHFVGAYGAPDLDAAREVAAGEVAHMREMCEDHEVNTLLVVARELVEAGVRETFSAITPRAASLEMVAVHGELD